MNALDIIILVVTALGAVVGYGRGLIRQVLGLVGLVCAFAIGYAYMELVAEWFVDTFDLSKDIAPVAGFVVVFAGVNLVFLLVSRFLQSLVGILKLGFFNRILGGALGVVTAGLMLSTLFYVLSYVNMPPQAWQDESSFYTEVYDLVPRAWDFATQHMPQLEELSERFEEALELPPVDPTDQQLP